MNGTSLIYTISLVSILTVALFSTVPNEASAQGIDFDYRCYTTELNTNPLTTPPGNEDIKLDDQFFGALGTVNLIPTDHTLTVSEEVCIPANKIPEDTGVLAVLPHLRCWTIDDPNPPVNQIVTVEDQFFPNGVNHLVGEAVEFCHTVNKASGTNPSFPASTSTNIANWKCYSITGDAPPNPNRQLQDQFTETGDSRFPEFIKIGEPIKLCTPATKEHLGQLFPVTTAVAALKFHLKCYNILQEGDSIPNLANVAPFTALSLVLDDQFTDEGDDINQLDKICADATKIDIVAGTLIPLDSVMILLAGAQISAVWILPALVATAGIGYGIDIARKYRKDSK